jgi:hypothetical protein
VIGSAASAAVGSTEMDKAATNILSIAFAPGSAMDNATT